MPSPCKGKPGKPAIFGLGCVAAALVFGLEPVRLQKDQEARKARSIELYAKLPLSFEANQGQADSTVKFLSRGPGYTLFLTSTEAVLALSQNPQATSHKPRAPLRMKLVGANPEPKMTALEELPGKSNYFIGNDPSKWRTNVPNYSRVRYESVYPGIDLVFYGNQGQLEFDFIVAPGANPSAITLSFPDAVKLELNGQGNLVVPPYKDGLFVRKPILYQGRNGAREFLPGRFILEGQNRVGFEPGNYDTSQPLVIDPMIVFSRSIGGGSLALDRDNNLYVTGSATSAFPATPGAFQTNYSGGSCGSGIRSRPCLDAYVAKLNSSGDIIFATYLGGAVDDVGTSITVDAAGNAYVTGWTGSANFPAASPIQGVFRGCPSLDRPRGHFGENFCLDAFVAKLSARGDVLLYSTFLGGNGTDEGKAISLDSSGNAYLTGITNSSDFPTRQAVQPQFGGGVCAVGPCNDAFVAKLSATGSELVYSTYLGGNGEDSGSGIATDSAGNAFVTGSTTSANFPATPGAFDRTCGTDSKCNAVSEFTPADAFATKLDLTGSTFLYSTYLGGSSSDRAGGIVIDTLGNAYLTGSTASTDFPTTPDAFQPRLNPPTGTFDAFITKLNPTGSVLLYSTFLGGNGSDIGEKLALDSSSNIYVVGGTGSSNFPTLNPLMVPSSSTSGGLAFLVEFTTAGRLVFGTYLERSASSGIAVDSSGDVYVTGIYKINLTTNPLPKLTSLSPTSVRAGSPSFNLTVRGLDFLPSSAVQWNGNARRTIFQTNNELLAEIPASDFVAGGTAAITVSTPPPGGGLSDPLIFTITENPIPTISLLRPASAVAGGPGFILSVAGSDFVQGARVLWNSNPRTTTLRNERELLAAIDASDVAIAGTAQVTVLNPPPGGGPSSPMPFTILAGRPAVNPGGMVNAASFGGQPPAPGSIGSLFGIGLAAAPLSSETFPLPTTLGGTRVELNGIAAPLIFVSPTQINFQIPWQLAGQTQVSVVVTVDGVASNAQTVNLSSFSPGLFALTQTGTGQGAILIAGTAAIAAPSGSFPGARPVRRGESISTFCTGLGPVTNPPASGAPASAELLSATTTTPSVTIGGLPARVSFSGLAPGFVGLYQVNAEVPLSAPIGDSVSVALTIGGAVSNTVTIAVQ